MCYYIYVCLLYTIQWFVVVGGMIPMWSLPQGEKEVERVNSISFLCWGWWDDDDKIKKIWNHSFLLLFGLQRQKSRHIIDRDESDDNNVGW